MRRTWTVLFLALAATLLATGASLPLREAAAQQRFTLKMQTAWPTASQLYESLKVFADRVDKMSAGRLKVEALPAGAVVPAFEVLDATHKGVIDGAHAGTGYWMGKHRAAGLFGPTPGGPFGFDMLDFLSWVYEGGGAELWQEFYRDILKRNVVVFPMTQISPQVLGWFKRPIKSWEDLKGLKCRQVAVAAEIYREAGMAVVSLPGGDIVPAGERGVIECTEWWNPGEDMKMGFHSIWKYYYMPSAHEPATVGELLINGDVWRKLPPDLQEIVKAATAEVTLRFNALVMKANAVALRELQEKHGVHIQRTPEDILVKQLQAWDKIAAQDAAKDAFFKKVYDSQRAWASLIVPAKRAVTPPYEFIANYYWPEQKK